MSVLHVNKENFQEVVLQAQGRVLVDFWATWCGPCQKIAPEIEALAEENEHIVVGKIDVDQEMELAIQFGVTSIPTLVLMEKGEKVGQLIGYRPKEDILKFIEG